MYTPQLPDACGTKCYATYSLSGRTHLSHLVACGLAGASGLLVQVVRGAASGVLSLRSRQHAGIEDYTGVNSWWPRHLHFHMTTQNWTCIQESWLTTKHIGEVRQQWQKKANQKQVTSSVHPECMI